MDGDSPGRKPFAASSNCLATSPDLFSSDDDDISYSDSVKVPMVSLESGVKATGSHDVRLSLERKDTVRQLESARLQRLMSLLQGVPPPPSVTIPQITLNEVLQKLKENSGTLVHSDKEESINSLWKPNASLEDVLKTEWPEIRNIIYHDMHFNYCNASEEVEHISMKLHERFIGAETSSWCNAVTSVPNSAKKRQRRSLGHSSPGCRLSHLARRRQTFSSANLAQLSSVAGSGTAGGVPNPRAGARRRLSNGGSAAQRCIMVEIKKTDTNKRIKTNSKEALNKVPLSGKAMKAVAETQTSQTTKRALFQSPEEQKSSISLSNLTAVSSEESNVHRSKRALWPSDKETALNSNGKRPLDKSESTSSQRSKVHCSEDHVLQYRATRSLPFSLSDNTGGNANVNSSASSQSNASNISTKFLRRASDQGPSRQDQNLNVHLSELHKRKLFWAITSALRLHGVQRTHSDFPQMASILAFHYVQVRGGMTGALPASTSEHMLQVVSSKAPEVVKAERTEKLGQEENLGHQKVLKKEERSNKELFRDATASLNVRRSLCISLSSNRQAQDDKPKLTKRVPSARKSLSFDALDPKTSSGTTSEHCVENGDCKQQLEAKGNDSKWRGNGENVPVASAKRVSRSLFLSPKDEVKSAKKDACEQTSAVEDQSGCARTCDESDSTSEERKKCDVTDVSNGDDKLQPTSSEISSVPSISAVSSTLEADNEASRTSEATNFSEQANSIDTPLNLVPSSSNIPLRGNSHHEKPIAASASETLKIDSGSSEPYDCLPTRVLRETKERTARQSVLQQVKRNRKFLSLSKRGSRSSSSDSADQCHNATNFLGGQVTTLNNASELTNNGYSKGIFKMEPKVVLSPLKLQSAFVSAESNTTSKSTFGSPPFIVDSTLTPVHSPFLGFPSKDDLNSSGEAADESNSIVKVPDGSSEEGNNSLIGGNKANLEEKVITPLLEAAILESSVCVGSGSSNSTDIDLSFRGRIESLKPLNESETAINLDLGMNLNVSANLLNIDENKEKSPVLEKWAERASRSAQKSGIPSEELSNPVNVDEVAGVSQKPGEHPVEESMLPWDESQMDGVSQCSTNLYEKFCSIFDPSSQQGTS